MLYEDLISEIRAEFPDFEVIPKSQSRLMLLIDGILRVLTFGRFRDFMWSYTTTLGTKVYTPKDWGLWTNATRNAILRHERVHMRQARRYSRLGFSLAYLFLPLPFGLAYCRAKFEMEAYEESIRARYELLGKSGLSGDFRESILRQFTGPAYLWMWPFRSYLERWYDGFVRTLTA